MKDTTIKVSRAVHQRIAHRAAEGGVSLGRAIEQALEESDAERFWAKVRADNAALSASERTQLLPVNSDNLSDTDDDLISARNAW